MRSLRGAAPKGPHSSVIASLASGAFYETIVLPTFYEFINLESFEKRVS
jgi:hypothetical protein